MTTTKEFKMTAQERRTAVVRELRRLVEADDAHFPAIDLAALLVPDEEPLAKALGAWKDGDMPTATKCDGSCEPTAQQIRDEATAPLFEQIAKLHKDCDAARAQIATLTKERDNERVVCEAQHKHVMELLCERDEAMGERDAFHRELKQIAASLSEYERVEAIGMQSATMPDKIDALLRDLVRLRKMDREKPAVIAAQIADLTSAVEYRDRRFAEITHECNYLLGKMREARKVLE